MPRSLEDVIQEHIDADKTQLPIFDGTGARVQEILSGDDFEVAEIEELISSDPALTTGVLRMANSSVFGGLEKVAGVHQAIVRLGARQVANLVLMIGVKKQVQIQDPGLHQLVSELWRHSVSAAVGAEWLARRLKRADLASEAFVAGLLHDVGKLFLLRVVDDIQATDKKFRPEHSLVFEMLDSWHTSHGKTLIEKWNLPDDYGRVVALHHADEYEDDDTLLLLVRLVDATCHRLGIGLNADTSIDPAASAEAHLLRVNPVLAAELEIHVEDALNVA
jgi:HD-like signal output (HDOD) protein